MELFLQMGHGMQSVARELVRDDGQGTVIISPMNIKPTSLEKFSKEIQKLGGNVLFDPQLYYPRKFQKNLTLYEYWPQGDFTALEGGDVEQVISRLAELNYSIGAKEMILPAITANKINYLWDKVQKICIEKSNIYAPDLAKMHTVALSCDVLDDEEQIESIVAYAEEWDVDGIYIVCEHPQKLYLVEKPLWVTNLMSLVAGLKRQRKKVVVGYASHQMLCLALAKCDAIASGNFLNLRWFQPEHFVTDPNKSPSRRAVWYYCPQALSEYKIPFLDIAKRMNLLDRIEPADSMKSKYCDMLFIAALPSSSGFGEKEAFRHYLHCLRVQCRESVRETYHETRDAHIMMLQTTEQLLNGLNEKGIKGQNRDFIEILDVNRAAIAAFDMSYQFPMEQEWNSL